LLEGEVGNISAKNYQSQQHPKKRNKIKFLGGIVETQDLKSKESH